MRTLDAPLLVCEPVLAEAMFLLSDQPISLADACIVRMAELFERHLVFTLDSGFSVYRKNGREPLNLIFPSRD